MAAEINSVTVVSYSLEKGGAAIAAARAVKAARLAGASIVTLTARERRAKGVIKVCGKFVRSHAALMVLERLLLGFQYSSNEIKHSLNILGSPNIRRCLANANGVVHLQWINNCTLSLRDIGRVTRPMVITLHDEWWYMGAEHYRIPDSSSGRYLVGYKKSNKDVKGLDIDRWIWGRKGELIRSLMHPIVFTVPSTWLLQQARESVLLRGKDIRLIPNCLDTEIFSPARSNFWGPDIDVHEGQKILLFGAVGGGASPLKGYDLLCDALAQWAARNDTQGLLLVSFGAKKAAIGNIAGIRHIELGRISRASELARIYSSADITVVPSRVEAFGQIAAESSSCGTPCIAFKGTGVEDIVKDTTTGFLASQCDASHLLQAIEYAVGMSKEQLHEMGIRARDHVVKNYSMDVVGRQLVDLYDQLSDSHKGGLVH